MKTLPAALPAHNVNQRVVVVGAGPAGMATAIELAQKGVPSVVLEKRDAVAKRDPVFLVAPQFQDRLAALDPSGSLTKLLNPIASMSGTRLETGATDTRTFSGTLAADPSKSRGDATGLVQALFNGADQRTRATVGIDALENGLRQIARTQHPGMIEFHANAGVAAIRQGPGWAEAVLDPAASGAARDAVRGAMLVDASGRDILGGGRTTYPEEAHFVGARFPAREGETRAQLKRTRDQPEGTDHSRITIALPAADRTLVWAQVDRPPSTIAPDAARALIHERARMVGVTDTLPPDARTLPVSVKLWTSDSPAQERVLKVGDSLRAPYFMTSTGAATALVHDAPKAVDAIMSVLSGRTTPGAASAAYADSVRGANAQLMEHVRPKLRTDIGLPPQAS